MPGNKGKAPEHDDTSPLSRASLYVNPPTPVHEAGAILPGYKEKRDRGAAKGVPARVVEAAEKERDALREREEREWRKEKERMFP